MADNKKYLEVFNDGTQDLHVRDAEAQAAITQIESTIGDINTALDAINGEVI